MRHYWVGLVTILSGTLSLIAAEPNAIQTPPRVINDAATELKNTVVSAYVRYPHREGESVIWCATMQLAWNEFSDFIGKPIQLDRKIPMADALNEKLVDKTILPPDSYIVRGGLTKDLEATLGDEWKKKFPDAPPPALLPKASPKNDDSVEYSFYACLYKHLKFKQKFSTFSTHLDFQGKHVQGFGLSAATPAADRAKIAAQVTTWYTSDTNFVIELHSEDPDDYLLLARIPEAVNLYESFRTVSKRIRNPGTPLAPDERLEIPMMNFDLFRNFTEITGASVSGATTPNTIASAMQRIRFDFNERGAMILSEADISWVIADGEETPKAKPRQFVFDSPFMMVLMRKDAKVPYFAFWVANPELLVPAKPHPK